MTIDGQLTEMDFLEGQALHSKASTQRMAIFWAAMMLLTGASIGLILYGRHYFSAGQLGGLLGGTLGGLLGGILTTIAGRYLYAPWKYKRIFRQQKALQLPFHISWTSEEFVSESKQGLVKTPWSDVVKWKENNHVFLLYVSDIMFFVLPKRIFPDATVLANFCKNLQIHVETTPV